MKKEKMKTGVKPEEKIKLTSQVKFGPLHRPSTCYCMSSC